MAGRIAQDDIQALRERASIAAVVAEYTQLRKAGATLKGLCPFHSEKSPSFTVDEGRSLYHCFGCGEGGDVYGFLQRIEGLTFPEAVERLARISGYQLRYEELSPGQKRALGRKTRLSEAVEETARFFESQLAEPEGEPARGYLTGRGLDAEAAAHFRLGWAPDRWDALVRHLSEQGFSDAEVVDAGLATQGRRGPVDRFRGRVIFPIIGQSGVVAFGGRILPDVELRTAPREGSPPKYINSAESAVYKKSETLYGLNWARPDVVRREAVLVVEGYMDVIGLHLAGVRHAVATCGTALTADHFRQLERFAPKVVLALDADDAGYAAADRARGIAGEVGIRELGVLPLPPGQDPADLAAGGREAVDEALGGVQTAVEFQITHLLRGADTSTPEGSVHAYRRTFPLLAQLPDRFLRYTYIRDLLAPAVRLSADRIERELDQAIASGEAPQDHGGVAPRSQAPEAGGANVTQIGGVERAQGPRDPQLWLEREALRAALQFPHLLPDEWAKVTAEDFTHPTSRSLFAALAETAAGDLEAVLAALPDDDARARVRALALSERTISPDEWHLLELVRRLRGAALQREVDAARVAVVDVNPRTDPEEYRSLTARLAELQRQRRDVLDGRQG
ncbi:DNA primase [soil metagenome]